VRRKQRGIQTIDEGLRSDRADTILEVLHRRTLRDVRRHCQAAEALKVQTIRKLRPNLFVQKIVQSLEHQNPDHGLSRGKWRATAFARHHSTGNEIKPARQCRKVNHPTSLDQRITQTINFRGPGLSSKQITFSCTTSLHHPASDKLEMPYFAKIRHDHGF